MNFAVTELPRSFRKRLARQWRAAAWSGLAVSLLLPAGLASETGSAKGQPGARPKKKQTPPPESEIVPDPKRLKAHQTESLGTPPLAPTQFSPDTPTTSAPPQASPELHPALRLEKFRSTGAPAQAPGPFNPDPGGGPIAPPSAPFFRAPAPVPAFGAEPVDKALALPRPDVQRNQLAPVPVLPPRYLELDPLGPGEALPREKARRNERIEYKFGEPDYFRHHAALALPANTAPRPDRWRIGFAPWKRYTSGVVESPYDSPEPALWHPYRQSVLKGDVPVIGQDIFLNLTASTETEFEARRIPTASGVSAARPGAAEFYGQSDQFSVQNNLAFAVELFKGETAFKPVEWAVHLQPVYNINYVHAQETGVVSPDPRGPIPNPTAPPPPNNSVWNPADIDQLLQGQLQAVDASFAGRRHTTRTRDFWALQEAFVEIHLHDLSVNYDFVAVRAGNQAFVSDFRGFIFNDTDTGVRLFGNFDNNRMQYNLAVFDLREKDTNSELNTFDERNQRVVIANLYRQDFLWPGYTAQISFHANLDEAGIHYDRNGNIVRPAPIGTVVPHGVQAYYLGWAGDGHLGRFNVSHALYQVYGHDDFNGLAGRPVDINAQMAAVELSYDRDWIRYKASFFYASGDRHAEDGHANGFDTIFDNPNFTGGPFSYFTRQGFNLGATAVNLKQRGSLVPNLRTSKSEGQANFVNPGAFIYSLGAEIEVTPKLRAFLNANYVRFAETDPLQTALLTDKVARELGLDLSLGVQYRPLLTDNIILSAGFGALLPGQGFKDIYKTSTDPVPGYDPTDRRGQVDDFLYSAIFAVTFTY